MPSPDGPASSPDRWRRFAPAALLAVPLAIVVWSWCGVAGFQRAEGVVQELIFGRRFEDSPWPWRIDVVLHVGLCLSLCLGLAWARRRWWPGCPWTTPLAAVACLALADELAQLASPQRSFDWHDLVADGFGLALAAGVLLIRRHATGRGWRTGTNRRRQQADS